MPADITAICLVGVMLENGRSLANISIENPVRNAKLLLILHSAPKQGLHDNDRLAECNMIINNPSSD